MYQRLLPPILAAGLLLSGTFLHAQNELFNDGGSIYVQSGGLIHVEGEVINDDQAANVGRMFNSGTVQLTGNWRNTATSNVFQANDPGFSIFLGNNALQTVGGTADTYFNNLTINKPGGVRELRLLRNARADGVLALNDDFLNTQAFTFWVTNNSPSAITRSGPIVPNYTNSTSLGYVTSTVGSAGRLARNTSSVAAYLFPVGTAARFRPVEITPTLGSANTYSVQFVDQATPSTNLRATTLGSVNPAWYHFLERTNPTAASETIRIYHDFTVDNVCDISHVTMTEWNGSLWADLSTTTSQQNPSPTLSWTQKAGYPVGYATPWNTNQFALAGQFFANGYNSCVFPVELANLRADPLKTSILVSWLAVSQLNNAGWFVERSENGRDFVSQGWVTGEGTTTTQMPYSFEDHQVLPGVRYFYRLRQQDHNGQENLSEVVTAILPKNGMSLGDLYPNPSTGTFYLPVALDDATDLHVDVVNMLGQSVFAKDYALQAGYQQVMIVLQDLAQGVYQVNLSLLGQQISKKLVLQ
jgi:Secretion system C-terminal sorting domain